MSKFEEYLEAVRSSINESYGPDDLMRIIKNREKENNWSGDGVYHYFNDIEEGAVVAYNPEKFLNIGRGFENKYKSYLVFHGHDPSKVTLVPATEEDGIPKGFVGWKWSKVPTEVKKLWDTFIEGHTKKNRNDFVVQMQISKILRDNGYSDGRRGLGISDFVESPEKYSIEKFPGVWKNEEFIAQLKTYASNEPKNKKSN